MTEQSSPAVAYPDGVTEREHIAHDMRQGRFPQRSSVETFLAERSPSVALEPCPFCGGEARMDHDQVWSWAVCRECNAEGPTNSSAPLAIAAWNRRAAPHIPAETGEVERLKADLKDEINFDLNTRINKVPESVVDQVVDLLAERGLLALAALPPSSGWEAGAEAMGSVSVRAALNELPSSAASSALVGIAIRDGDRVYHYSVPRSAVTLPPPPSKEGV